MVGHSRPNHIARRRRTPLLIMAAAYTSSGVLGWVTAPAQGGAAVVTVRAASPGAPPEAQARRKVPRIVKLQALGTVVDVDDLKSFSAPELARLGAQKWTEMLGTATRMTALTGGAVNASLDEYFAGWLAVVGETSPYSDAQFSTSLQVELCRRPLQEREVLRRAAPAFAKAGDCPAE